MGNCLSTERPACKESPGILYTADESHEERPPLNGHSSGVALEIKESPAVSPVGIDPMVQKISEEIAEFREQLRRGQEQIQAMSNSVSSFDTTKSCPGLVELKGAQTKLPSTVGSSHTIATQTESVTVESTAQTTTMYMDLLESVDTFHDLAEFTDIDEMSQDDSRYRLLRGSEALSVIEESEHEIDLSPGALQRKMSADKNRPRLVRMRNTIDDPPPILEEDIKSDLDYLSATSSLSGSKNPSLYNSLERPLHVSHRDSANGDDVSDTFSTVSGGNTTYGSPISSPSSPTYLTPSQGSSSQETLTNHDGDKTPINYEELLEDCSFDRPDSALRSGNSSRSAKKPKKSSWQMLPIDNREASSSVGVIPDEDQEHMRQYAYDVTLRSCNSDAAILSRKEWRTLRSDLDQVDMEKFKKGFGQDDDREEKGFCKTSLKTDLDEVAESYCEQFPFLAETIFQYLESTAQEKVESVDDLPELKKRFEELASTFRTDHDKLEGRSIVIKNEHDTARKRISEILSSLKQTVDAIRAERLPGEIRLICNSIENWVAEIELQTNSLDCAAQRSGRLDVVRRVFKIIEVMVLYVRILNNVCGNLEEERKLARQMLEERGIDFPKTSPAGNMHHNNNNHEMGHAFNVNYKPSKAAEERSDSGAHILQRLLGPKQTSEYIDSNFELNLRPPKPHPARNFFPKVVYECYEAVLREFNWPWDMQDTWGGVRKTFALLLMLFGIFLISRISLIPPCESAESIVSYNYVLPPRI